MVGVLSFSGLRKKEMVDGIHELDMIEKGRSLIEDERLKKDNISRELESMILLE
jgi:hypothetical protein